jgi:hypothetical protein
VGADFSVYNNDVLTNVDGLKNLSSVDGYVYFYSNNALTNIDSLVNLTSVGKHLWIENNDALSNLDGLTNLTSVEGNLVIKNNHVLTNCCGIYPLLCTDPPDCTSEAVDGSIHIEENPFACNNMVDIISTCLGTIGTLDYLSSYYKIYPNPCTDILQIEMSKGDYSIQIFDIYGRKLSSAVYKNQEMVQLDLSEYIPGLYIIKIKDRDNDIYIQTMIKNRI